MPEDTTIHDVASLIKMFFRELDEGLLFPMRAVILQFGNLKSDSDRWLALASRSQMITPPLLLVIMSYSYRTLSYHTWLAPARRSQMITSLPLFQKRRKLWI